MPNSSPWIHQLNHERPLTKLSRDESADVAIVGAGIAGISTAFFLLKHTDKRVVMLEGYKLGHGATGHNAGQITSYFERPFRDIVAEFGLETACQGQKDIEYAWELADEMYTESGLDILFSRFESYAGLSTLEQVLGHLENNLLRRKGGLLTSAVEILHDAPFLAEIPEKYHKFFTLITREEAAFKLETFDPQYMAVLSTQKGVMNSALFCQEVASFLIDKYKDRFALYEHAKVEKVVLKEDKVVLDVVDHTVVCDRVILCTNGFDNFSIFAPSGLSINTRFHHGVHGVVAFMAGYLEPSTGVPAAISYFQKEDPGITDNPGDPYFYVTRRPFEHEKSRKHNLICVGGPDFELPERAQYDREREFSQVAREQIQGFVKHTYDKSHDLEYHYMWHGVMGYTTSLLRMIGPDPEYSHLFYNLGCNGVGILPSIFGGYKVAKMLAGEKFEKSIFDIPARAEAPVVSNVIEATSPAL